MSDLRLKYAGLLLAIAIMAAMVGAYAQTPAGSSPARTLWEKSLDPKQGKDPAFQFVEEDPKLPRVLLVGDSISIGYTVETRALLKGKANVLRIPTNGGATSKGLESLDSWLGTGKWDVIHFNWGLHDIKRLKDGRMNSAGEPQTSPEQYEKNLEMLVAKMKSTGAKLMWASTTPVPEGANGRVKGEEVKANAVAEKVMTRHGIAIDDLYACALPQLSTIQRPRNVHFTKDGSAFLARQVAAKIEEALAAK